MKSNVKIYNNSNLDTKVVGYGDSTNLIKIYHNSLDYQTGEFFNITFSVNDSTMGSLSTTPTPDSQLGYQPVAIRFDGDKVRENDLAKWTVTATPLSGYKFSYWLLNGQRATDAESYVLQEDTTIQAVFITATITVTFYNSPAGQWYADELGKNMMDYKVLPEGYYVINGMYQGTGYWYLDYTDTSTETHSQWYFIPESGWSYAGLEINGKVPTFPYTFGTSDLTIAANTEQANALIIESDEKNGRWVDSSGTYMASAVTIPYASINISFEGKQQSPNSITSLRFSISGDKDNEMFNYTYYYEYIDGCNTYLELDGNSMSTSETWGVGFNTGQHILDARAEIPLWKYYGLHSSEKTAAQNFINSSDNCLGQWRSSVFDYSYCFCNTYNGILLCIDRYSSNYLGFTMHQGGMIGTYACGTDSKLSNMDFNAIVNFEGIGDTNNIEHALTNGGFSNLDDFCEYIVIKFNL